MPQDFDIAIVGSGYAGALLACILRRLGRSVVLIERGRHPRPAIGESSTPLANLIWEYLARRYDLLALLPLAKWGSWQRAYPQIGCGLKRGFTFYHHKAGCPFGNASDHSDQLLVAASPSDDVADTHWYRQEFDHFLVCQAVAEGANYLDEVNLTAAMWNGNFATLEGERHGRRVSFNVRLLVDASGPHGFLHHVLRLSEKKFAGLPATEALFTHFSGVRRMDESFPSAPPERPPYLPDDAAVHHVFDGGWIWVLRFNNGVVSAGVAASARLARQMRLASGAPGWQRLLETFPTVAELFAAAKPLLPFTHVPRLSFRSRDACGAWWTLLPSAAGFVDPMLSTGFPLTLLGIARLAEAIEEDWANDRLSARLKLYEEQTLAELDAAGELVSALYASMNDFPLFTRVSLLYFAAITYTESVWRAGGRLAQIAFLLNDHPLFGPELRACCREVRAAACAELTPSARAALISRLSRAIEQIDLIGFSDPGRRNWFPFVQARSLTTAKSAAHQFP